MKNKKILALTAAMLMLSGCAGGNTSSDNKSELSVQSSLESTANDNPILESSVISLNDEQSSVDSASAEEFTILHGLAGDVIKLSEITAVNEGIEGGAESYSDEEFEKDSVMTVKCSGFSYLAECSQPCFNSIDNADVFNPESGEFEGASNEPMKNYKRVNVGDTVGGMTVTSAECDFANQSMNLERAEAFAVKDEYPEIFFSGTNVVLSGEVALKGYACAVVEDEYGVAAGDIIFVPSGSCPIPVMSYSYGDEMKGICHKMRPSMRDNLYWNNEYGNMILGNINEITCDTSAIPDDGSFAAVTITIDSLKLSGSVGWFDNYKANITAVN